MILSPDEGFSPAGSVRALLNAASEMLGARVEIHISDQLAPSDVESTFFPLFAGDFSATVESGPCGQCAGSDPESHRACIAQRSMSGARRSREPAHWTCGRGCELSVVPLSIPDHPDSRLLVLRPHSAPNEMASRPESLRFISQLGRFLSDHLVMSKELSSISGELSHRCEELDLLYTISQRLSGQEDMRQALRTVLEQARGAVGASAAFLDIPELRIFETARVGGAAGKEARSSSLRHIAGILQARYRGGPNQFFSGTQWDLSPNEPVFERPAQIFAVPLLTKGELRGVVGLLHFDPVIKPRMGDLKLLQSLSERIALAVASNDLYDNLKDFLMATVKSLVSAIEAKDPYTCGHSERVNLLSLLIGKTMGLSSEDLEVLRWASILHDVGKIGMPESILNKPGRLTPEEFAVMKEHPDRGYKVLAPIRQLATAGLAVRSHHEMYDGRGYPLGLKGERIPLLSRIIAVADTYDALTSTRSYRPRRSPFRAFEVIESVRGTQLDPAAVDVLEKLMPFISEHEVMLRVGDLDIDQSSEDDADQEARAA
jgi:HD-GYP domain-containing protein (c-di-GMP phosphodiesterase class II)